MKRKIKALGRRYVEEMIDVTLSPQTAHIAPLMLACSQQLHVSTIKLTFKAGTGRTGGFGTSFSSLAPSRCFLSSSQQAAEVQTKLRLFPLMGAENSSDCELWSAAPLR